MTPGIKPGWLPKPDRDELLTYLFDRQAHLLAMPMATWLAGSRRFAAFVTAFRTKIRKKLRATQEMESLLDLQLELETAYLLLREPSLSLAYEPQLGGKLRGPDFAVSFTTSLPFMVEVTRLRKGQAIRPAVEYAAAAGSETNQGHKMRSCVARAKGEQDVSRIYSQIHEHLPVVGDSPPPDSLRAEPYAHIRASNADSNTPDTDTPGQDSAGHQPRGQWSRHAAPGNAGRTKRRHDHVRPSHLSS